MSKWVIMRGANLELFPAEIPDNVLIIALDDNKIASIPDGIGCFRQLRELCLSANQLTVLPSNINMLKSLTVLGLQNNHLRELPSLVDCTALRYLNLTQNKFTTLPSALPTSLTGLYISRNKLEKLELHGVLNLIELSAENNRLTAIRLEDCTRLRSLVLNDNQLETIDCSGLPNLRVLSCRNNQLTVFPHLLTNEITQLTLQLNQIAVIPGGWTPTNLHTCLLQGNKLTQFPVCMGACRSMCIRVRHQTKFNNRWQPGYVPYISDAHDYLVILANHYRIYQRMLCLLASQKRRHKLRLPREIVLCILKMLILDI